MGLRSDTRVIGENEYEIHQMGFKQTRETFVRLCNVVGPSFISIVKELVGAASKSKTKTAAVEDFVKALGDVDLTRAADVLGEFLGSLDDKDLNLLTEVFGAKSRYRPMGATGFLPLDANARELLFGGDGFVDFFQWLAFALEVNYKGFFSGASGLQELVRGAKRAEQTEK